MQLSHSTISHDPSLMALLAPGSAQTAAGNAASLTTGAPLDPTATAAAGQTCGAFEQVFSELSSPGTTSPSSPVAAAAIGTAVPHGAFAIAPGCLTPVACEPGRVATAAAQPPKSRGRIDGESAGVSGNRDAEADENIDPSHPLPVAGEAEAWSTRPEEVAEALHGVAGILPSAETATPIHASLVSFFPGWPATPELVATDGSVAEEESSLAGSVEIGSHPTSELTRARRAMPGAQRIVVSSFVSPSSAHEARFQTVAAAAASAAQTVAAPQSLAAGASAEEESASLGAILRHGHAAADATANGGRENTELPAPSTPPLPVAAHTQPRPPALMSSPVSPDSAADSAFAAASHVGRADAAPIEEFAAGETLSAVLPEFSGDFAARIASQLVRGETATESKANFADRRRKDSSLEVSSSRGAKKTFVGAEPELLTPHRKSLGIDVAKSAAHMFAHLFPAPVQHPASEYAAAAGVLPGNTAELATNAIAPAAESKLGEVSDAREAVEVVLRAAEQVSLREQKSVQLQFSVGDAELTVRVDLHLDEVRATFRTDSAELRQALSREWQAIASSPAQGDRTVRLAPAVITGADQSAANGFSGDASSYQRNPHAGREAGERAFAGASRTRSRNGGVSAVAASASLSGSAGSPAFAPSTSLHLHTLA